MTTTQHVHFHNTIDRLVLHRLVSSTVSRLAPALTMLPPPGSLLSHFLLPVRRPFAPLLSADHGLPRSEPPPLPPLDPPL